MIGRRRRTALAGVVTAGAMALVLAGTWQASVPFVTPADLGPGLEDQRVQVEGVVEDLTAREGHLGFRLADGAGNAVPIRYVYEAQRPLTLEDGRIVVAKGRYESGSIDADQVSVRAHEEDGQAR